MASRGAGEREYRMNTDFARRSPRRFHNGSTIVWMLAILAPLTWVAWSTDEMTLLIFLRVVLGAGSLLLGMLFGL